MRAHEVRRCSRVDAGSECRSQRGDRAAAADGRLARDERAGRRVDAHYASQGQREGDSGYRHQHARWREWQAATGQIPTRPRRLRAATWRRALFLERITDGHPGTAPTPSATEGVALSAIAASMTSSTRRARLGLDLGSTVISKDSGEVGHGSAFPDEPHAECIGQIGCVTHEPARHVRGRRVGDYDDGFGLRIVRAHQITQPFEIAGRLACLLGQIARRAVERELNAVPRHDGDQSAASAPVEVRACQRDDFGRVGEQRCLPLARRETGKREADRRQRRAAR